LAEIDWTEKAVGDLGKLDRQVANRVVRKIRWLANNFEKVIPEPLGGEFKGSYKLRIGDWRAIYTIESNNIITVQFIGHRRDIYKK
jgi:mRNA interferase RelE/StbE